MEGKNMPQRYKVVKRKTRMSALVNGHSTYARKYLPGTDVYARGDTLGIMTFKTRYHAENWAACFNYHNYGYDEALIVILVETIGRGKVPEYVANGVMASSLREFYKDPDHIYGRNKPPDDTVCYPGVHVLE